MRSLDSGALDLGVTLLHTANIYGDSEVENCSRHHPSDRAGERYAPSMLERVNRWSTENLERALASTLARALNASVFAFAIECGENGAMCSMDPLWVRRAPIAFAVHFVR
jgi:hypothetical protein